ncbi:siderophore-interacting protein [Mesobaculum littorinae]|uniref:Siderophore-interacting protein n=1 Tax=Mesobaculum littorinae TaxID=2486419 RepID=A0A438AJ73_9RHOB|nr:siderophore-interacting protein [Mesobaculum littorinae]RVV98831.1 siderophore-interacting protein [Mesobaculum littorinae]
MTRTSNASATFAGPLPPDLLPQIAGFAQDVDLHVVRSDTALRLAAPRARIDLAVAPASLAVRVEAEDISVLHMMRDYLLYLLDQAAPGLASGEDWQGDILRNRLPPNFCTATVRSVRRVAPRFLRVELECAETGRLAREPGMHFALLLPPRGREPVWPRLDGAGRTVLPEGADRLHRAAYTFVDLDPDRGRFTFDVFEHEGGRTTAWARTAEAGEVVGITGPGSGDLPPGRDVLIAGDETALPAIRWILAASPADRRGRAFVEVGTAAEICDMQRPEGVTMTWLRRDRGEGLWDVLSTADLPGGPDRYVWVAGEKQLLRKAKLRFRTTLGLGAKEGYFAHYWEA